MTCTTETATTTTMLAKLGSNNLIRVLGTTNSGLEQQQLSARHAAAPINHHGRKSLRHRERLLSSTGSREDSAFSAPVRPISNFNNNNNNSSVGKLPKPGAGFTMESILTSSTNNQASNQMKMKNCDRIKQSLAAEEVFYSSSCAILSVDPSEDRVDSQLRDDALAKLRSLHVAFYGLSTETFCRTSVLIDLFCTRVRVRPKYIFLVAAACYHIILERSQDQPAESFQPSLDNLISLYKCGGTQVDLLKMVQIIFDKLTGKSKDEIDNIAASTSTHKHFLDAFYNLIINRDEEDPREHLGLLYRQLEIALCSSKVNVFRPSCIALSLLYLESLRCPEAKFLASSHPQLSPNNIIQLASLCRISREDLEYCGVAIGTALGRMNKKAGLLQKSQQNSAAYLHGTSSSPPLNHTLSRRNVRAHLILSNAMDGLNMLPPLIEHPDMENEDDDFYQQKPVLQQDKFTHHCFSSHFGLEEFSTESIQVAQMLVA